VKVNVGQQTTLVIEHQKIARDYRFRENSSSHGSDVNGCPDIRMENFNPADPRISVKDNRYLFPGIISNFNLRKLFFAQKKLLKNRM